jgi:kanamycin nucleotidyltransferase
VPPESLKPHTRAEREAVARALIPLWQRRFGDGLLAVAATGSFARGDDGAYSDLELIVFLRELPGPGEDPYLQRIVDGMLVEAEYVTEEAYVQRYATLSADWFMAGSAPLLPLYNAPFVERVVGRVVEIRYPREQFLARAGRRFIEVQEACGKVLSAIEAADRSATPLLFLDAVMHVLVTLSFLNERPFTTFARYVDEARALPHTPARLGELLDVAVDGRYHDPEHLRDVVHGVVEGLEQQFRAEGVAVVDADLDPDRPNRRFDPPRRG